MARDVEIRVYDWNAERMLRTNRDCLLNYRHHSLTSIDRETMQIFRHRGPTLSSYVGKPIDFGDRRYPISKFLVPFLGNRYDNFDQLLADMVPHGYFITDYRRLKGVLHHYNDILPLVERGYVIEDFAGQVIVVKRDKGLLHGNIWVVNDYLLNRIKNCGLVRRDPAAKYGCCDRIVYVQGDATLATLSERQRDLLDARQARILADFEEAETKNSDADEERERRRVDADANQRTEPVDLQVSLENQQVNDAPKVFGLNPEYRPIRIIEAPAFKKPPRAEPLNKEAILGRDHRGVAITFKEVLAEGRKTPPKGLPSNLIPEAPDDCTDEEWERLMLIEQIKFRRRQGL